MKKVLIAAAIGLLGMQAQACDVASWFWNESSYSKTVIKVDIDMKGCKGGETVAIKVYEGNDFLGSATTYVQGGSARYPLTIKRAVKGKNLQLHSEVSR